MSCKRLPTEGVPKAVLARRAQRRKYYHENKARCQAQVRKRRYGIASQEYDGKYEAQGGCCAICGVRQSNIKQALAIDHNHVTGGVRDLLCGNCNRGIGLLQDSAELCLRAAEYLQRHERHQWRGYYGAFGLENGEKRCVIDSVRAVYCEK